MIKQTQLIWPPRESERGRLASPRYRQFRPQNDARDHPTSHRRTPKDPGTLHTAAPDSLARAQWLPAHPRGTHRPGAPPPRAHSPGAAEDSRPGRSTVPGLARIELALEPRGPAQHQPLQRQLHERPQSEQVECERQRRARLGQRGLRTPALAAALRPPPHPPAAPRILLS